MVSEPRSVDVLVPPQGGVNTTGQSGPGMLTPPHLVEKQSFVQRAGELFTLP